jgi:hypothetical protein
MFAELYGVDVWFGEEAAFRLLEVYRPRPGASATPRMETSEWALDGLDLRNA